MPTTPPVDYLMWVSHTGLQELELRRLNDVSELVRQRRTIDEQIDNAREDARIARWLIEYREALLEWARQDARQTILQFPSDRVLPEAPAPPRSAANAEIPRANNRLHRRPGPCD